MKSVVASLLVRTAAKSGLRPIKYLSLDWISCITGLFIAETNHLKTIMAK